MFLLGVILAGSRSFDVVGRADDALLAVSNQTREHGVFALW